MPTRFDYSWPGLSLLAAYALLAVNAAQAEPSLKITSVPAYGAPGTLQGKVEGVANFQDYRVAPYIHIEGLGWWTKPTFAMPTVDIKPDGTFSASFITGGVDDRATILGAVLVPAAYSPPPVGGSHAFPSQLNPFAKDFARRFSKTIQFAGHTWGVKELPVPGGPGSNVFSNSAQDIWVDQKGLHLTVNKHDGHWWATEAINTKALGYGRYEVQTNSRVDVLDPTVTFGAFTWDAFGVHPAVIPANLNRELDIEDARWGNAADPTNSQFVVQPFNIPENFFRYTVPDLSADVALTRILIWSPTEVRFLALKGHHTFEDYAPGDVIVDRVYKGAIPTPGEAAFRFNLWPSSAEIGRPGLPGPSSGLPQEVIVSGFRYVVPEASTWISLAIGLAALLVWSGYRRARAPIMR